MHIRRLDAVAATLAAALILTFAQPAAAQQRPLVTRILNRSAQVASWSKAGSTSPTIRSIRCPD